MLSRFEIMEGQLQFQYASTTSIHRQGLDISDADPRRQRGTRENLKCRYARRF